MRYTVMAVDDVLLNLMILESILEEDYDVVLATSGEEALVKMLKSKPDLVLLDLSMPDMDGFELVERMHKDNSLSDIPVIFVTGEYDAVAEEKGLSTGAVDYIKKPYIPGSIRVKIKNHIELKTYRDELAVAVAERTKELEQRTLELVATHSAIIMGMSLLSESRDKVTGAHLARIKNLTELLANQVAKDQPGLLDEDTISAIITYSPLHDVGKVSVPDAILNKPGKLTDEEFTQMKSHTAGGGELLRQMANFLPGDQSLLSVAIDIAECHHERFDGTGYPRGLSGDNIPLSARIVSVADVYDALRSARPYKRGLSHEESMDIILKGDGRTDPAHFDPRLLSAFKTAHEQLKQAYDSNPDPQIIEA